MYLHFKLVIIVISISNSITWFSEPKLVFNIYQNDIHVINLEKVVTPISFRESDILINTTGSGTIIGEIDYSLSANILIWRKTGPEGALFVAPIDIKNDNMLGITEKRLLFKLNNSSSIRVSMDWTHNLIYFNEKYEIIVINMTSPHQAFIVIRETNNKILDLSVNPVDSTLFWTVFDNYDKKGRIMKSLQDGSEQVVLLEEGLKEPRTLSIDLISRRIYWIDRLLFKFCSIDFDGNDIKTIISSQELFTLSHFMDIFGDDIYWSNYYHSSILKTNKYGLNGSQINYLVKSDNEFEIESIKVIDKSLQPDSVNRCIYSNCSHICIPISTYQYRCVCPQIFVNNHFFREHCIESTHTIKQITIEENLQNTTQLNSTNIYEIYKSQNTENSTIFSLFTENNTEIELLPKTIVVKEINLMKNLSNFHNKISISNFKTSAVLYTALIISLTLNVCFGFVIVLCYLKRRNRQCNKRPKSRRIQPELRPFKFERIDSETNYLIHSNPLIANAFSNRNNNSIESNSTESNELSQL